MLSSSGSPERRFLGRALAASLALHLLLAFAIPSSAPQPSPYTHVDYISRVSRSSIEQPPSPSAAAPRPPSKTPTVAQPPAPARSAARPRPAPGPKAVVAVAPSASQRQTPPAQPTVAQSVTSATAQPSSDANIASPAPVATAQPATREVANTTRVPAGYMPFGADLRDPVLDPNVRKQIEALGVHAIIAVSVSDDGRTKTVAFQTPVARDVQTAIESLLADAAWDPAYCGAGIPCAGETTLRI